MITIMIDNGANDNDDSSGDGDENRFIENSYDELTPKCRVSDLCFKFFYDYWTFNLLQH